MQQNLIGTVNLTSWIDFSTIYYQASSAHFPELFGELLFQVDFRLVQFSLFDLHLCPDTV